MKKLLLIPALLILGFSLEWLGSWSNLVVITANGGAMPVINFSQKVAEEELFDPAHTVLTKDTKYKPLCDLFVLPVFYYSGHGWEVMSIGDICMESGELVINFIYFLPLYWLWRRYGTKQKPVLLLPSRQEPAYGQDSGMLRKVSASQKPPAHRSPRRFLQRVFSGDAENPVDPKCVLQLTKGYGSN